MKKILLLALLITTSITASAVPNFWNYGYVNRGYSEALISNSFNHELNIACDVSATDSGNNHSVGLTLGNKYYSSRDDDVSISFLFDRKKAVGVPSSADTRLGTNEWNDFVKAISKASRIQVFINNKKVTAFLPKKAGRKALRNLPKECSASF